ncbi:MAG: sigma-70 family RNA polymerase sigma factor [Actinobacteria bacterium]|nr:sigma-70 family RNA polymerase sigma factor [Actinomycetota bacterium]
MDVGETSDGELVALCRAGDERAWAMLVERYSRYVYAIAVQGFRLPEPDAEDIFQDAFARAFERLDALRDDDAFRPWLAQMTRRLCIDSCRRRRDEGEEPEVEVEDPSGELDRLDEALAVREGLTRLSGDCREILDRFFAQDESYRTIGEALQLPAGTIASRISRCLGHLRAELEGRKAVVLES